VILLLESVHDDALAVLRGAGPVSEVPDLETFDETAYRPGVRGVVTRGRGQITDALLAALPDVEVVARCGAGLDNVDTVAAAERGVIVVHAPGLTTDAVAEHAVGLMLAIARRLVEVDHAVKSDDWAVREGFVSAEMRGKRLGIVGMGAIGSRLAELGSALAMDVVCSSRRLDGLPVERLELDELLRTADVIQLCVPLTGDTRGLIGPREFGLMKPSAILVNTARGPVVDHAALADALTSGQLGGYAADVWDPEPPRPGDVAIAHPRTLVTPHVAGLTDTTYREICLRPAEAVADLLGGRVPDPRWVFGSRHHEG
jgi:D-3-phosphoglycerate dehydrogenase